MVLYAVFGLYLQYITQDEAMKLFFAAMALVSGRSAIQKVIDGQNAPLVIKHIDVQESTPVVTVEQPPVIQVEQLG